MVIKILDYVQNPSSYEDGEKIYRLISPAMKRGERVVVSFAGVASVPSAFINAALIRLLEEFSYEDIKSHLVIADSTKHINELIRSRFDFVMAQSKSK